jgi:hypothetical protein
MQGSITSAFAWVLATVILASLLILVADRLYERTLISGLGIFGGASVSWRRKAPLPSPRFAGTSPHGGEPRGEGTAGSPTRAIARKDWLGYRRDVRRLTRLLPALLLPLGYAAALSQLPRNVGGFWSNVTLLTFLSMFMCGALALPSVPSERRGFQLLRMAPLTMWQLLRAKIYIALPPVLATLLVFSVAVAVASKSDATQVLELVIFGFWLTLGFVAISVSGGAIDPRFDATDDRRSVGLVGTLAAIGGTVGFAVVSIGALALFVFGAQATTGTADLGPIPSNLAVGLLMMFGGVLLVTAGCVLVAVLLWLANARLGSLEAGITAT